VNATTGLCHAFEHALEHALEHSPGNGLVMLPEGSVYHLMGIQLSRDALCNKGAGAMLDAHGRTQRVGVALGGWHAFLYATVAQRSMKTQRWSAWGLGKADAMITGSEVAEVACHRL